MGRTETRLRRYGTATLSRCACGQVKARRAARCRQCEREQQEPQENAVKKNEVKVGKVYATKIGRNTLSVRIDGTNSKGGWNATNTATGKRLVIKSAERLCKAEKAAKNAADDSASEAAGAVPATAAAVAKATPAAAPTRKSRKPAGEPKPRRVSALDAAARVLQVEGKPMRCKDLIAAMSERGLWSSPNGKTPEATLYSAILREIATRGAQARFRKVERGQFERTAAEA
jgi:hypothetical protein